MSSIVTPRLRSSSLWSAGKRTRSLMWFNNVHRHLGTVSLRWITLMKTPPLKKVVIKLCGLFQNTNIHCFVTEDTIFLAYRCQWPTSVSRRWQFPVFNRIKTDFKDQNRDYDCLTTLVKWTPDVGVDLSRRLMMVCSHRTVRSFQTVWRHHNN